MNTNHNLRVMTEADLPAADNLRQIIGWNQTLADWQRLLALEPNGCFVAMKGPDLVGTVTTTSYGQSLAWIGMMLVHPAHRRQGIGRQLMQQAVRYLQTKGLRVIKLDATPAGQPLYEQLGFSSEWTLTRWQRRPGSVAAPEASPGSDTRPLEQADWLEIVRLDQAALGAERPELLRGLQRVSGKALAWPSRGPVLGWGLLRPGANADYLGPVLCAKPEGGLALISALMSAATTDRPVFWDMPDANEVARRVSARLGFERLRPLTRMCLGPQTAAADPSAVFGIADPAVG